MALTGSFTISQDTVDTTISSSITFIYSPTHNNAELRNTTASSWWVYPSSSISDVNYDGKYVMVETVHARRHQLSGGVDQSYDVHLNVYNNKAERDSDITNTIHKFQLSIDDAQMDLSTSTWDAVYGYIAGYSGSQGNFTNLIQD